ncbi:MAG: sulfatase-like hydrolase/transferase, partial [Bryobacteraceae bacterium]
MSGTVSSGRETTSEGQSSLAVPAQKTELLKRAAIALSIANLCFLFVWGAILHIATQRTIAYFLQRPPDRGFLWALLLDVIVLGTVTFLLLSLRRSGPWPLRFSLTALLALICLFALYQCERSFNGMLYGVVSARVILGLRVVIAIVIVLFIIRSPKRTLPRLRTFFLVVSPLFLVFAAQGLWAYYGPLSRQFQPVHVAGMLPASAPHTRVIWIIFDELDYRMLFPARPARVQLPHFDALRDTSIFADHVKSPAPNTLSAIPSLLLSKDIPGDEDVNLDSRPVQVRFNGCSQFVALNSEPNVFQRARDLGANTAVAGWYHPYCRLFGNELSTCASAVGAETGIAILQELLRDRGFLAKAAYLANWQARVLPLEQRLAWVSPMPSEDAYLRQVITDKLRRVLNAQARMLKNPDLDFVFLHIPSPHPPGIWDTQRQTFATDARLDYIDNLELADHILGRIRRLLEQTGDWNRSTILVSSDHPYR